MFTSLNEFFDFFIDEKSYFQDKNADSYLKYGIDKNYCYENLCYDYIDN